MDKKLKQVAIFLAIVGLAISIYMTIYKITSNDGMCLGSGDCSTINASPYSEIYGIPVAALGIIGYLAILFLLAFENKLQKSFKQYAPLAAFGLSVAGFTFSLYLVYIEVYVVKALCPFCVASQVTMAILFVTLLVRLAQQTDI